MSTTDTMAGNGTQDAPSGNRVDRAARAAHDAVDRAAQTAHNTAESMSERGEQLRESQDRLVSSASQYLRDKPIQSLGIAAVAGFVLARMLSR